MTSAIKNFVSLVLVTVNPKLLKMLCNFSYDRRRNSAISRLFSYVPCSFTLACFPKQ